MARLDDSRRQFFLAGPVSSRNSVGFGKNGNGLVDDAGMICIRISPAASSSIVGACNSRYARITLDRCSAYGYRTSALSGRLWRSLPSRLRCPLKCERVAATMSWSAISTLQHPIIGRAPIPAICQPFLVRVRGRIARISRGCRFPPRFRRGSTFPESGPS